jgi:ubiquinone/menaquinone biosynthesis C-methylase UbiE
MEFDRITEKYDAWFLTPLGAAVDAWEKDVTWRFAQPVAGEKVLDIGTGTANYLIELAAMGLDCTGLDIGLRMLLRGKRKGLQRGLNLKLVTAASEALKTLRRLSGHLQKGRWLILRTNNKPQAIAARPTAKTNGPRTRDKNLDTVPPPM